MTENIENLPAKYKSKDWNNYVNHITIDWVRFSFLASSWPFVMGLLDASGNPQDWQEKQKYKKNYATFPCEGVTVYANALPYGDRLDTDRFLVDFTSSGLGHLFQKYRWMTLYGLFEACLAQPDVRVNRLDIAFDCYNRLLNIKRIHRLCQKEETVITKWSKKDMAIRESGMNPIARTLTLGNRKESAFARIYDKRLEQIRKGVDPETLPASWVRWEIEFKKYRGLKVTLYLLRHQLHPTAFTTVLQDCIDFRRGTNATQYKRPADWWSKFLHECEQQPVQVPEPQYRIDKKKAWLEKSVAKTMALILEAKGGDMDWVYDSIRKGKQRFTPEDLAMLRSDEYRKSIAE